MMKKLGIKGMGFLVFRFNGGKGILMFFFVSVLGSYFFKYLYEVNIFD